jgi:hypothetical protein
MQLTNHANLSEAALSELSESLPAHGTLMELVAWGSRQTPPLILRETVMLDEYTHEVLVPWGDALWLVYSST